MAKKPQIETRKLTALQPDSQNANAHTERGVGMLERSLEQFGAGRSIVVDKHGTIVAGNQTQESAIAIGLEDAIVVHTTGEQVVVVQRDDLDLANDPEHKARGLAIADNRVGEVDLAWYADRLKVLQADGLDLGQFWREDELNELLTRVNDNGNPPGDPGDQIDKADEL